MYEIKDINLWESGEKKVYWADRNMPVLKKIREKYKEGKPLRGMKIGACLHVTKETAVLVLTLKELGAEVFLCASNPLSTQDDIAAYLAKSSINVFAKRGETKEEYYKYLKIVAEQEPDIIIDDGGDLHTLIHKEFNFVPIGGTEETTTGVNRLKALEREGKLKYPVIAVNNSKTKYLFDNRYGTGQSSIDGILRATNVLLAGKTVVVAGYGWCGRGIAMRARGMGARVIVTEVDPIKALEAVMDGFAVKPMCEAAKVGDIFITATGDIKVIKEEHIKLMKDGAILANAGHFNVEVWIPDLEKLSIEVREIRPCLKEYKLKDGRRIYLLGEGRLVNLVCAEGHPSEVMDMSFSNQAMACLYLKENGGKLESKVYTLPEEIDKEIAKLKLESMGIKIDELTEEQKKYLESWESGT